MKGGIGKQPIEKHETTHQAVFHGKKHIAKNVLYLLGKHKTMEVTMLLFLLTLACGEKSEDTSSAEDTASAEDSAVEVEDSGSEESSEEGDTASE